MPEEPAQPATGGAPDVQFTITWDEDEDHFTISEDQLNEMLRAFADITAWAWRSASSATAESILNIVADSAVSQEFAELIYDRFKDLADRTICEFQLNRDPKTNSASIHLTITHEDPAIPSPS